MWKSIIVSFHGRVHRIISLGLQHLYNIVHGNAPPQSCTTRSDPPTRGPGVTLPNTGTGQSTYPTGKLICYVPIFSPVKLHV